SRLVQCSPRLHVCVGLHPGAILSYRPLPNRRLDAESLAPTGPRGRRQGRSRAPISPKHARRLGRTGGSGWIGSPEPPSVHAHPQTSLAERGQELRGGLHVPRAPRAPLRRRSYILFGTMGVGRRTAFRTAAARAICGAAVHPPTRSLHSYACQIPVAV